MLLKLIRLVVNSLFLLVLIVSSPLLILGVLVWAVSEDPAAFWESMLDRVFIGELLE